MYSSVNIEEVKIAFTTFMEMDAENNLSNTNDCNTNR
jgi:hypothetical protein